MCTFLRQTAVAQAAAFVLRWEVRESWVEPRLGSISLNTGESPVANSCCFAELHLARSDSAVSCANEDVQ